jgi:signal transduction histidine kinase
MRGEFSGDFKVLVHGNVQSLHPVVFDELSKIGREALGNAFRHSGAQSIEAELSYDVNELRFRIRDDGAGIDPQILTQGQRGGHFGLPGMRERARRIGARFDIWSRAGAGTEIDIRIPAKLAFASQQRSSLTWWHRLLRLRNTSK